jgi:hypothetical protein
MLRTSIAFSGSDFFSLEGNGRTEGGDLKDVQDLGSCHEERGISHAPI